MRLSPSRIAAAAACVLLTACTGQTIEPTQDKSDAPAGKGTSIRWLIEEPEDAAALKALKDHVATFEKQSGIKVETTTLPFDTMRTVLQTQLRSGEGPDVFNWGSGPSFGGALIEAGLVADISDAYDKHGWKIYDFAKERVTANGKVYGIPGEMETIGLFYNKDVFTKLGIQEPKSLDDLRAAADKVRASGMVPLAVGNKEGWEGGHLLSMALSSDVGSESVESMFGGEKSWNSPEVVSAFGLWKDFNDKGLLPKSPTSVDYDTSTSLYFSGKAAMIPTGSWLVGEIDDNAKFESGYIPFPAPDGPGIFTGGLGSGPFVSATTKKKDAAIQFLNFLASEDHGRWTVENLHTIPAQPIKAEGLEVSPLFAQVLQDTAKFSEGGDFGHNIDVMVSDAVNKAMYDGMQGVMTGQRTPEAAAAAMEKAAKK
ncbi:MAG TPA: extracellular solute-binding protein [Jatrophihabitans sp.]|uniref:ABC transporter substrate-binding protein n=1 Tax=Jatrophihabitans sp. TaxID=1932789 RepID=UPI002F069353